MCYLLIRVSVVLRSAAVVYFKGMARDSSLFLISPLLSTTLHIYLT